MTTSISSASIEAVATNRAHTEEITARRPAVAEAGHTLASRFVILALCLAVVLSTLAFGTVHNWSLAFFGAGAGLVVVFWAIDALQRGTLRISRNALQWPLVGLCALGLIQLLPLGSVGSGVAGELPFQTVHSLSLDPYTTRIVVAQLISLLIYFAAALAFIDSPGRLRLVVRVVIIFGSLLALYSLLQFFVSPTKIYGVRGSQHSIPFGPFINRHHFAGYMELALALPLGLLFSGAISRDRALLYGFAAAIMSIALIMTNSRGGIVSLVAEILFLVAVATTKRGRKRTAAENVEAKNTRFQSVVMRIALGVALILVLFAGAIMFGGEESLSRLVGTVNAADPTTGRTHFWRVTLDIIRDYPLIGAGLGAYGLAYTQYDTSGGMWRVEQAHNDYLQVLADAGVVGAVLGLFFLITLFRVGFKRRNSNDVFRGGVATGALAGCFAVLVHSLFDFTLHTTSNALLFLMLVAFATINGRVEEASSTGRRRRRHRHRSIAERNEALLKENSET